MSPAGTSVSAPICLDSSRIKETQNLRISLSDLPLGSKSAPPLPPPMFTRNPGYQSFVVDLKRFLLTTSQGILKDLFKSQELENRQVHGGVEPKTSLIWPQGRVELDTISSIDLDLPLVILPDHSELDDSFRYGSNLEGGLVFRVLLEEGGVFEGRNELCHREVMSVEDCSDKVACGYSEGTFISLLEFWLGWQVRHCCFLIRRICSKMPELLQQFRESPGGRTVKVMGI